MTKQRHTAGKLTAGRRLAATLMGISRGASDERLLKKRNGREKPLANDRTRELAEFKEKGEEPTVFRGATNFETASIAEDIMGRGMEPSEENVRKRKAEIRRFDGKFDDAFAVASLA